MMDSSYFLWIIIFCLTICLVLLVIINFLSNNSADSGLKSSVFNKLRILIAKRKTKEDDNRTEKLGMEEERLKLASNISSLKLASWDWGVISNRVVWSPELVNLVGFTPEHFGFSYEGYLSTLHPDDRVLLDRAVQNCILTREDYETEYRALDSDGSIRWFLAKGRAKFSQSGKLLGLFGIVIETTERKRIDAAIQQSEKYYRNLANSIPAIIFTADTSGHFNYINQRWIDYTGRSDDETSYGSTWLELVHPDDVQRVQEAWQTAVTEGRKFAAEVRLRSKSSSYSWFVMQALPLVDRNSDTIEKWFGSFSDINDLKTLENKLQEADQRKNEFLSMLAHELRNPLAPVRNGLEIMRVRNKDNDVALSATIAMMARQVNNLVLLVDDLLDVARITSGKISLKKTVIKLSDAIAQAVESCDQLIKERQQHLTLISGDSPIYLLADQLRLIQIFSNLLNNASKYTDKGGSITITSEIAAANAKITVMDDGIGITAEMLPYVFDVFSQSKRTLDRSQGGLGIGLTIVKQLVEKHGGYLTVASEGSNKGSQFTVFLPRIEPGETLPIQPFGKTLGVPNAMKNNYALKILIVEDNEDIAASLQMMLGLWGFTAERVGDGIEAIAAIPRINPDVILLDIGLPHMNGYEVAKKIRRDRLIKDSCVLFALTGYGQEKHRQLSVEAGFDRHLVKPVDSEKLKAILLSLV